MQAAFRLTDQDQDLRIPPDSLLHHLESSLANFDSLLKDLHCTAEDLHETINDPQTNELLKLKTHLATLQLKLLALRYIPTAFHKLIHLMNTSEKPEVARRAATTVLNIAGIATHTAPDQPTAPTPQPTKEEQKAAEKHPPTPEDENLLHSLAFISRLQHHGLDLRTLQTEKIPALITFLTTTCNLPNTPKTP